MYQDVLRREQKAGKTFPQARATALAAVLADRGDEFLRQLSMPNNILALEYCKALRQLSSSILPLPILRQGNGYHDEALSDTFCSATALREALLQGQGPGEIQMKQQNLTSLLSYIPETCHPLFLKAARAPVTADDFLPLLIDKLLTISDFSGYFDISPELSDRIRKLRFSCIGKSFAEIAALLKTRQLTEAPDSSRIATSDARFAAELPVLLLGKRHCLLRTVARIQKKRRAVATRHQAFRKHSITCKAFQC